MKRLLSIIILAVILFSFSGCSKVSYDINEYNELLNEFTCLPAIEELGEYTDLKFKHIDRIADLMFNPHSYTLRATYKNDEFLKQKDFIDNNFIFQDTVVIEKDTIETEISANFETESFNFRILSFENYSLYFPKEIIFIGISKTANEIVYIVFDDTDLDFINCSLQEFLEEECGWEE